MCQDISAEHDQIQLHFLTQGSIKMNPNAFGESPTFSLILPFYKILIKILSHLQVRFYTCITFALVEMELKISLSLCIHHQLVHADQWGALGDQDPALFTNQRCPSLH